MKDGVPSGYRQRVFGEVCSEHPGSRQGHCRCHGNTTRSGSHIRNNWVAFGKSLDGHIHKQLSFGAGNEHCRSNFKLQATKLLPTQQVLQRFSATTFCNTGKESFGVGFWNRVLKVSEKVAAVLPELRSQ